MQRNSIVKGLDIMTHNKKQGICEDCIIGKHTCRPFYTNDNQETEIGEQIYTDLWGPSRIKSIRGKLYMMMIIDGMNLAIAATLDMEAWQVDYIAAYLNSHPQAITYIALPDGAKVEGKIG
jgi:hypothetical protein